MKRGFMQSNDKNECRTVVCDIDGVLANGDHRNVHLGRGRWPTDWTLFHRDQHLDPVIPGPANLVRMLYQGGVRVYLLTNRPVGYRTVTEQWLVRNGIPSDGLFMRGENDEYATYKPMFVERLLKNNVDVQLFIDDDPMLCQAVQDMGVPVLYVHSGYFDGMPREDMRAFEAHRPTMEHGR